MTRRLPQLTPKQMVRLQDALFANADKLLTSAVTILDQGNVGLARSLAILGMEESGKSIALHERRVQIAFEPEGSPFVNQWLEDLWSSHQAKLELVHNFLVEEQYWFGTEPSDPEANEAALGTIKRWVQRHDKLKQRGFYVDVDKVGGVVVNPSGIPDQESLAHVIEHIHQIGWQLRLGEHIEATRQADVARATAAMSDTEIEKIRQSLPGLDLDDGDLEALRRGRKRGTLNNDGYRLRLPDAGSNPFQNLGNPGYEAETKELTRLAEQLDEEQS